MQLPPWVKTVKPYLMLVPSDVRDRALAVIQFVQRIRGIYTTRPEPCTVHIMFDLGVVQFSVEVAGSPEILDEMLALVGLEPSGLEQTK